MSSTADQEPDAQVLAGKQMLTRLITGRLSVDQHAGDVSLLEPQVRQEAAEILDPALTPEQQQERLAAYLVGISQGGWQILMASLMVAPDFAHLFPAAIMDEDPAGFIDEVADEMGAYWQRLLLAIDPQQTHQR